MSGEQEGGEGGLGGQIQVRSNINLLEYLGLPDFVKISSIILMLRRSTRSLKCGNTPHPSRRSARVASELGQPGQFDYLLNALETLDNRHVLMLLESVSELNQQLLCLRASLSHQLNEHQNCLAYARRALVGLPECENCLTVYLSHAQSIPPQELPLNEQIMAAILAAGPQLIALLPPLLRLFPNSQRYSSMVLALKHDGSIVNKVGVIEGSEGRRVIAISRIDRNEQLLFIPKDQLVTLELARQLPLVQLLLAAKVILRSPKHTQLAIFLLEHFALGSSSPFASYLAALPSDFGHFPVNYSEELLAELRGTCFLEQIEHKKQDMQKDYQAVLLADEGFGRFSFRQFCEARLLVSSRVFGIVVEQVKTDALVPMADMLNHRLPKQTSWFYCDRTRGFVIQSLKEILPGFEVFDSYGQKCNSRFLLNYGFVLPSNPHNEVVLVVDLINVFEGVPKSAKIRVSRSLDSKCFEEMLGLLRATLRDGAKHQDESEEQFTMGLEALKQTAFKDRENEAKVWKTLDSLITEKLTEYPTSLAEDKRLLQECRKPNLGNVLMLRRGEKEVLNFYQTMSRRVVRYLESDGRRGDVSAYQPYIDNLMLPGPP